MSVERDDSFGDRDIYVSFAKNDSAWSEPLNLGKNVNTAAEDASPFLAADDKTLYFSSRGSAVMVVQIFIAPYDWMKLGQTGASLKILVRRLTQNSMIFSSIFLPAANMPISQKE